MKAVQLLSTAVFLFSAIGATAPSPIPNDQFDLQQPIGSTSPIHKLDGDKVPGSNPLYHCEQASSDLLIIKKVDLTPNPPQAGKDLSVVGTGQLLKDVENGAKVEISVKYGLITILRQEIDLCKQVSVINQTCPLQKGDMSLNKTVTLPSLIPPGDYAVEANVLSKGDDIITCLKASVTFGSALSSFREFGQNL